MATQKREGNLVMVNGMSLKGGDLPKDFKVYLNVVFDYTDVTLEELQELASEGSSIRVKAQAKLRKWTTNELREHGVEGDALTPEITEELNEMDNPIVFKVATDFESEGRTVDPKKSVVRSLGKMSSEERIEFLMEEMGLDRDMAEAVSAKHD